MWSSTCSCSPSTPSWWFATPSSSGSRTQPLWTMASGSYLSARGFLDSASYPSSSISSCPALDSHSPSTSAPERFRPPTSICQSRLVGVRLSFLSSAFFSVSSYPSDYSCTGVNFTNSNIFRRKSRSFFKTKIIFSHLWNDVAFWLPDRVVGCWNWLQKKGGPVGSCRGVHAEERGDQDVRQEESLHDDRRLLAPHVRSCLRQQPNQSCHDQSVP